MKRARKVTPPRTPHDRGVAFHGLFRGQVVDNLDPLELNRVMVEVPTLPGTAAGWAMPSARYGGMQVGLVLTPPIGANVWVAFENGDPSYPVWVGCFWTELEKPVLAELPTQQVMSTGSVNLMIDDVEGAGQVLAEFGPAGFETEVTCLITGEGVVVTVDEVVFTITAEEASALMEPTNVVMTNEGLVVEAGADIDVTVPELSMEGDTTHTGAVEVVGDVDATGAVQVVGDIEIVGAVEVEGEIELVGAAEFEGEIELVGAIEIEGEIEMAGAIEAEGEVVAAGAIESVGEIAAVGVAEGVGEVAMVGAFEDGGTIVSSVYTPSLGNLQ